MDKLKQNLEIAVREVYKNKVHNIETVNINDIVIERHPGGKRTGVANMLINYIEGDFAWIERKFRFEQPVKDTVIITGIDNELRDTPKDDFKTLNVEIKETLREADIIISKLTLQLKRLSKTDEDLSPSLELVSALSLSLKLNLPDAIKEINNI